MPTYSYRCTECSNAFDVQQSFTDDSLTVCPRCKGVLRKVFSPIGVSFSGSGFYRNDSRATPAKDKEKSGSEPAKSSSAESKPASTPAKESASSSAPSGAPSPKSSPSPKPTS